MGCGEELVDARAHDFHDATQSHHVLSDDPGIVMENAAGCRAVDRLYTGAYQRR